MNKALLDRLGERYAQSLAEVVETTSGISLSPCEGCATRGSTTIVAAAGLQGEADSGILALHSNAATLRLLTSYITGAMEADITEDDLNDCLQEIVNMTIGIVKLKSTTQEPKYQIAAPFVFTGDDIRFLSKRGALRFIRCLGGGDLFIELNMFF